MPRLALALFLFHSLAIRAQEVSIEELPKEVETIHSEKGLRNALVGFAPIPVDAKDHSALAGHHQDTALLPASTLKAVTTATALDLLGTDFRFETVLQHTGSIGEDGTLKGDVVIRGSGDPTLGKSQTTTTFINWQTALKDAGIVKVEGRVIGDASLFGTQLRPGSWQWNDLGNYYATGACGLTFHRNEFHCRFNTPRPPPRSSRPTGRPRESTLPDSR